MPRTIYSREMNVFAGIVIQVIKVAAYNIFWQKEQKEIIKAGFKNIFTRKDGLLYVARVIDAVFNFFFLFADDEILFLYGDIFSSSSAFAFFFSR